MKRLLAIAACLLCGVAFSARAEAAVTFDQIYGHEPPGGRVPSRIAWAPDGHAYTFVLASQDNRDALDVRTYDVATHRDRVLIPALKLGMRGRTPGNVVWAPDSRKLAFVQQGSIYVFDMQTARQSLLAKDASDPHWSPDGRSIAFNKNEELYVAAVGGSNARRLTFGARDGQILNGDTDWVYPEELSTASAFDWSPDGLSIAYLRFDERPVTAFPIVDFLANDNSADIERYPLAGEANPKVSLHTVSLTTGADRVVYDAAPRDEYLPWFAWIPHSNALTYEIIDRAQQHVRVVREQNRHASTIYDRNDGNWVDVVAQPLWLGDGSSYWIASDGHTRSLFRRDVSGHFANLTSGVRVFDLAGIDGAAALVVAGYPTRRDQALLRIDAHGTRTVLTGDAAFHRPIVSPNGARFLDYRSTLNEPTDVTLCETHTGARTVIAARNTALQAAIAPTEMLTVDSPEGPLDATMLKPPNFDASKRYPVIVYVYGGPEAPTTQNHFGNLYHQLLAQAGYIVFSIDGPESQVDNEAHLHSIRYNFGPAMLAGQERGAAYLATLPYVDPRRIGIWGWSYGGYATIYTLEHSTKFAAGVAVAPVTDWHFYDSIYTERYMGLPKQHARDYDRSSDLLDAKHLAGPLLINHGTGDDNVHMANTISMMQAFISADRSDVDFAVYPRQLHGIAALADQRVLFRRMLNWWQSHLPPG